MIAWWAAMALAVLAKGLIGALIPGATLAIYALWQRDGDLVRSLRWVRGGAVFTALALPWFALAARRNPQFLRFFFIREHLQRFLTPIEHRSEHWWFFVPILLLGTLPWVAQALRALATAWRGASRREPAQPEPARTAAAARGLPRRIDFDAGRLLWIWTVFVLVFFSCSDAKLIPYILPAIPTLALLCADPLAGEHRGDVWIGACGSLAAAAGMLAYAVGAIGPPSGLPLARTLAPILVWTSAGLGLSVALAIGLLLRAQARAALGVLCAGWLWTTGTVLVGADRAAHFFSAKYVARLLEAQPGAAASAQPGVVPPAAAPSGVVPSGVVPPAPPGRLVPVFCVQTYEQSLPFYLRRTVILVDYRDELDFGLRADPDAGIGSVAAFASRWRGLEAGYAVMPFGTHTRLAREGLPMRVLGRLLDLIVVSRR
jgi:4-amino-4-deoxy-L-arabinose transferase-like glycosyltransferase